MVEVILKKEVRTLGDRGEVVRVAPGYARNFLIPQGLAMPATAANKHQIEEMRAAGEREATRLTTVAEEIAQNLDGLTIRIVEKAGDRGQLFGSVTNRDIAAALAEAGHRVDRHQVVLGSPLRRVDDYDVLIHLYKDVDVTVKVEVRAEGREDELFLEEPEVNPMEEYLTEAAEGEAAATAEGEEAEAAEGEDAAAEDAVEAAADAETEGEPAAETEDESAAEAEETAEEIK